MQICLGIQAINSIAIYRHAYLS